MLRRLAAAAAAAGARQQCCQQQQQMLIQQTMASADASTTAATAATAVAAAAAAVPAAASAWLQRVCSHGFASTSGGSRAAAAEGDGGFSGGVGVGASHHEAGGAFEQQQQQHHEEQQREPQPQLLERLLSDELMGRSEQLHQRKSAVIAEFQRAPGDVGSPEVQIALLTERIRDLAPHFAAHRKDHHSRRGLQGLLNRRRKLLSYLRRSAFDRYALVLHRLGLKDTYAKQRRYDRYRVGSRLGAPAEALKRYGSH